MIVNQTFSHLVSFLQMLNQNYHRTLFKKRFCLGASDSFETMILVSGFWDHYLREPISEANNPVHAFARNKCNKEDYELQGRKILGTRFDDYWGCGNVS